MPPGTGKGHVFITLEDEHSLVNVILRPRVHAKYRLVAWLEPFIVVEGTLQKKEGVAILAAEHLTPL